VRGKIPLLPRALLLAFLAWRAEPALAGMCVESQPCGTDCIPWDQLCHVDARPGSEEPGWQSPWELLNGDLVRGGLFCWVYVMLVGVARQKSIGPREV